MTNTGKKSRLVAIIIGGLLLSLVVVGVVYAATTIDTFNEGDHAINLSVYSGKDTDSDTADHSSILGGERDAYLERFGGTTDYCYLRTDLFDSNRFAYTSGDGMTGKATITWDGNDSDATNLDPDGLGSTNLQSGGDDGFLVQIINNDLRADLTITVYEYAPSTDWSYSTVRLSGLNPGTRMDIFYPFSSFQTGGGGGADFSDAGSIIMELDGTIDASVDVSVDLIETSNAREYGDLPEGDYGTTVLSANHIPQGLRLGQNSDAELTYNSSTAADGDDGNQVDDEDGVTPTGTWSAGTNGGSVSVVVDGCSSGTCYVSGWIDWSDNDSFGDTGEAIFTDTSVSDGTNNITFDIPGGTTFDDDYYYARFRICESTGTCNSVTVQNVLNGEVEDYRWYWEPTAVTLSSFTAEWDGDQVAVAWETAMEINTVGFNLWHSTSAGGGYAQVNDTLIPSASPGGVWGGSYAFADSGVTPGMTYYYKLEELEVGGARNWYGPVSTEDGGPTAVMLSAADTALAWWPVAAGVIAGSGLTVLIVLRRRRRHL